MHDMKKNIRRVFWLYFAMFLMVVLYLGNFILVESKSIVNSTYNPRLNKTDSSIKRGAIFDADGNVLAESIASGDSFQRVYPYGKTFAHTAGFIHTTKAGVEAKYNFSLISLDREVVQRANNLLNGVPLEGDSVKLTIDASIQKIAEDGLGSNKGGVVAMEPSTGRIIAMVSYPAFDPNDIAGQWESLAADEENSPLLNRAAQGLYPPGSVFKVVTAVAIIENMPDYEDFYYECKGSATFGEDTIRCYDSKAHGTVNLASALQVSCNTFFSAAVMEIGYDKLAEAAVKARFNSAYNFDLEKVSSRFSIADTQSPGETMQTAIGQGKTLATPLHMAMIASAIANNGVMMEPYVCQQIISKGGRVKSDTGPGEIGRVFTAEQSDQITDMMVSVVEGGTGVNAAIAGIQVAGKTGTAENSSGDDHGWFIAFAPADDPQIAVAIITEGTGGARKPMGIAKEIMKAYLQ